MRLALEKVRLTVPWLRWTWGKHAAPVTINKKKAATSISSKDLQLVMARWKHFDAYSRSTVLLVIKGRISEAACGGLEKAQLFFQSRTPHENQGRYHSAFILFERQDESNHVIPEVHVRSRRIEGKLGDPLSLLILLLAP